MAGYAMEWQDIIVDSMVYGRSESCCHWCLRMVHYSGRGGAYFFSSSLLGWFCHKGTEETKEATYATGWSHNNDHDIFLCTLQELRLPDDKLQRHNGKDENLVVQERSLNLSLVITIHIQWHMRGLQLASDASGSWGCAWGIVLQTVKLFQVVMGLYEKYTPEHLHDFWAGFWSVYSCDFRKGRPRLTAARQQMICLWTPCIRMWENLHGINFIPCPVEELADLCRRGGSYWFWPH